MKAEIFNAWHLFLTFLLVASNFLMAFGTIAVAVLALFGDAIKARCFPPKLHLHIHTPKGTWNKLIDGRPVLYYLLKVVNSNRLVPAKNCKVLLRQIARKQADGRFESFDLTLAAPLSWSPREIMPAAVDISTEQFPALGLLIRGEENFKPALTWASADFNGFVGAGDVVRYSLEMSADLYKAEHQTFEVEWDGQWSEDTEAMALHLKVKEVFA